MADVGAAGAAVPGAARAVRDTGSSQEDSQSENGQPSGGGGGSSSGVAGKKEGEEEEKRPFVRPQTSSKLSVPQQDGELLQDGTVRINTWSTPRSLSTALMYSFAQRPDTVVYDEPLCAHFLRTHKEEQKWRQGYLDEVFKQQDSDGDRWIREVALGPSPKPVVYMKHIANMTRNLDLHFLPKCRNIIQIRTPIQVLPSWNVHIAPSMNEIGMLDLLNVYSHLRSCGQEPIVVDAELLRTNPEGVLTEMCEMLGIPFAPEQLSWTAGPKPYDGCWGYAWYEGCRKSTCFDGSPRYAKFDPKFAPLLEECMPIYELFRGKAVTGYGKLGKIPRALPARAEAADQEETALGPVTANEGILVWVGGHLLPRRMAKVSVFDSSIQGGDAVGESVRVYNGRIFMLERHLQRLQDSAHALAFDNVPSSGDMTVAIMSTLAANDMTDGVHVRVTLSRGVKTTSSMNPSFSVFGCTLIVLAERDHIGGAASHDNQRGTKLVTAVNRRSPPQCLDSAIHHNNLVENLMPKIQANVAGASDAVMLDVEGFVIGTNAANIFLVKDDVLITPLAGSCLPGITRGIVLHLASELCMSVCEKKVTLSELHCADEVFTAGTRTELTPVVEIDGRQIGDGSPGRVTTRLTEAFVEMALRPRSGTSLPKFK